jgi:hypothetical protein
MTGSDVHCVALELRNERWRQRIKAVLPGDASYRKAG